VLRPVRLRVVAFYRQAILVFVVDEDIVCGMRAVLIAIDIIKASIKVPVAIAAACGAVVVALQSGRSIAYSPEPGYARHNPCLPVLQTLQLPFVLPAF
jgi:hypothetical protein